MDKYRVKPGHKIKLCDYDPEDTSQFSGGKQAAKTKNEQKERLQARLDDPKKQWKFNPADLKERALWDEYSSAYQDAISETSTEWAPWYVIPANRNWYRNLSVASVIVQALEDLKLKYPEPADGLDKIVIQ
jgi:hypothetical protein